VRREQQRVPQQDLFEADPELLREVAAALVTLLPEDAQALAGLELGGIPLAAVASQITRLPTLFVRKQAKDYGTCRLAEGGDVTGRRLVVVEDVLSSGECGTAGMHRAARAGSRDRRGAMRHRSRSRRPRQPRRQELRALFTMSELGRAATTTGPEPVAPAQSAARRAKQRGDWGCASYRPLLGTPAWRSANGRRLSQPASAGDGFMGGRRGSSGRPPRHRSST
jgi:orotate phosphoribosyltransferase